MHSGKHCKDLSGKNSIMQLLPSLQIFKTAALKNDKVPERNNIEEGEEKGLYFNSGVGEMGVRSIPITTTILRTGKHQWPCWAGASHSS